MLVHESLDYQRYLDMWKEDLYRKKMWKEDTYTKHVVFQFFFTCVCFSYISIQDFILFQIPKHPYVTLFTNFICLGKSWDEEVQIFT
jgi:hypothetical protein